jgi:hypothetical protein
MRIVGEIPHPDCKITLLSWNNRYLIKVEQGFLEQTFKIDQFDLAGDADLQRLVDNQFVDECLQRFLEMGESMRAAMARMDSV